MKFDGEVKAPVHENVKFEKVSAKEDCLKVFMSRYDETFISAFENV